MREDEFADQVAPLRHELRVHCYRMLGSWDEAEDLVQETLLKAWDRRDSYEGRASIRAWLYKIATNACLDFLRRHERTPAPYDRIPGMDHGDAEPPDMIAWLQPCPAPEVEAEARETIELAFLAGLQHLPPRQRAVLVLRDVLGWPAADTADLLELSVASVNSALQRARPSLRERLPERREEWRSRRAPSGDERQILERYIAAAHASDAHAIAGLLHDDVVLTMPPNPFWFVGREAMLAFLEPSFDPASPTYFGEWRSIPTTVNSMPASANYVRRPGTTVFRAQVLDVLTIVDGEITEITAFEPHHIAALGLPLVLPEGGLESGAEIDR